VGLEPVPVEASTATQRLTRVAGVAALLAD